MTRIRKGVSFFNFFNCFLSLCEHGAEMFFSSVKFSGLPCKARYKEATAAAVSPVATSAETMDLRRDRLRRDPRVLRERRLLDLRFFRRELLFLRDCLRICIFKYFFFGGGEKEDRVDLSLERKHEVSYFANCAEGRKRWRKHASVLCEEFYCKIIIFGFVRCEFYKK